MAYSVPPLPYAYDALEPHIDKATMEFHHDKHHQAYVDKVNAALEGTEWADKPIEDVLQNLDSLRETKTAVKNNGGGHYNHTMFWENMSPDGGGEPDGELASAIASAFGSFADFQAKMKETGVNQFGSGWAWLVRDGSGLAVVGSANQDNPISDGQTPLLGVDVWEHSYYLKYQNRRPDYIDAWWNVVNWHARGRALLIRPARGLICRAVGERVRGGDRRCPVLLLDGQPDLLAVDRQLLRRSDPQAHGMTADLEDGHEHIPADHDALSGATRQHEHELRLRRIQAPCVRISERLGQRG